MFCIQKTLLISEFRPPVTYYTSITNVLERPSRRFDAALLKDVRRRLDSGQCSQEEIDELTIDMTEEAAEVSQINQTLCRFLLMLARRGLHR